MVGGVLQSQDHNVSLLTSDSLGTSRVIPGDVLFSEVLKQSKGDSVSVRGKGISDFNFKLLSEGSSKYNLNCSFNSGLDTMACIKFSYLQPPNFYL